MSNENYQNPIIEFDVGDSQPFFCDIIDQDGEFVRLEWNGGDVIITTPQIKRPTKENGLKEAIHFSCPTPNIPVTRMMMVLIEFQTRCIVSQGGLD